MTQEVSGEAVKSSSNNALNESSVRTHAFSFTGSFKEYFGIWFVNILLTIITLGIYSPWAKVRNAQYFYNHTFVADANFQYLADPMRILIGRLIAIGLFIAWQFSATVSPLLSLFMGLVFMMALPWMIISSLRFQAVNSAYRNIRFDFQGTYGQALFHFIVLPVIMVIVMALLLGAAMLVAGGLGISMPVVHEGMTEAEVLLGAFDVIKSNLPVISLLCVVVFALSTLLYAVVFKQQTEFFVKGHRFGDIKFNFSGQLSSILGTFVVTFLIYLVSVGVSIWVPSLLEESTAHPIVLEVVSTLMLMLGLLIAATYFGAQMRNYVYNHAKIGEQVQLRSQLNPMKLLMLRIFYGILAIVTLGMLWPLLKIKTAQLLADATAVESAADLETFFDTEHSDQRALGDEVADVFDVGFGV